MSNLKTFTATVVCNGTSMQTSIQAANSSDADRLLKAQYPNCRVVSVQEKR